MHEPKARTLIGLVGILAWMIVWVVLVVDIADSSNDWPFIVEMLFYLVAGIGWIIPLKPVLRWMETGRFKA